MSKLTAERIRVHRLAMQAHFTKHPDYDPNCDCDACVARFFATTAPKRLYDFSPREFARLYTVRLAVQNNYYNEG